MAHYVKNSESVLTIADLQAAFDMLADTDPLVRVSVSTGTLNALRKRATASRAHLFYNIELCESSMLPDGIYLFEYKSGRKVLRFINGRELELEGPRP